MSKQIAIVALAPGKVGFYDPLTRIHLTLSNPRANIADDMNLKQIRKSIASGTLKVVYGNLPPVKKAEQPAAKPIRKLVSTKKEPEQPQVVEPIVETPAPVVNEPEQVTEVETASVEEAAVITETESVAEAETVTEEAPKKRGRKKADAETDAEPEITEDITAETKDAE